MKSRLGTLLDKLLKKRMLLISLASMLAVMSVPLLACVHVYQRYSLSLLEQEVAEQNHLLLNSAQKEMDDLLLQLINVGVAFNANNMLTTEFLHNSASSNMEIVDLLAQYNTVLSQTRNVFYIAKNNERLYTAKGTYYLPLYTEDTPSSLILLQNIRFSRKSYFTSSHLRTNILGGTENTIEFLYPLHYGKAMVGFQLQSDQLLSLPDQDRTAIVLLDREGQVYCSSNQQMLSALSRSDIASVFLDANQEQIMIDGTLYRYQMTQSRCSDIYLLCLTSTVALHEQLNGLNRSFTFTMLVAIVICTSVACILVHLNYRPINRLRRHAAAVSGVSESSAADLATIEHALQQLFGQSNDLENRNRMHLQSALIKQLIVREISPSFIQECSKAGMHLPCSVMQFCILYPKTESDVNSQELLLDITRLLQPQIHVYSTTYRSNRGFVLLLASDERCDIRLHQALSHLTEKYGCSVCIGIGSSTDELTALYRSYNEARSALRYCQKFSDQPYIFFTEANDYAQQSDAKIQSEIESLYQAITNHDLERGDQLLASLTHYVCSQEDLPVHLCYDIVISMIRAAKQYPVIAQALQSSPEFTHDHVEFVDSHDFKDFVDSLYQIIMRQLENENSEFNQACMIVQQHLLDPNFYQEELAESLGISLSSLNNIFREHANKTPSAYILSMRQEYAKHQLITTDITISALAKQLGYSQPSSFIRTFKREEGMTPGEYRQLKSGQAEN